MLPSPAERDRLRGFVESCQKAIGRYACAELDDRSLLSLVMSESPALQSKLAFLIAQGVVSDVRRRLEAAPEMWPADAVCAWPDWRVESALRFIRRHVAASVVRIADAAKEVGISPSRLAHLVTKETGTSWSVHVRNARLQAAARLLVQTSLSVKEVAARVGYTYVSSFDRDFRRVHIGRPSDFRRARQLPPFEVANARKPLAVVGKARPSPAALVQKAAVESGPGRFT
jgi:AraC-like DNA-binding protein